MNVPAENPSMVSNSASDRPLSTRAASTVPTGTMAFTIVRYKKDVLLGYWFAFNVAERATVEGPYPVPTAQAA